MAGPLHISKNMRNGHMAWVLLYPCTEELRHVLRSKVPPSKLTDIIKQNKDIGNSPDLTKEQEKLVLPVHEKYYGNYQDMDISLLYKLLKSICKLPPPSNGWGENPDPSDRSVSANIERIHLAIVHLLSSLYRIKTMFTTILREIIPAIQYLDITFGKNDLVANILRSFNIAVLGETEIKEELELMHKWKRREINLPRRETEKVQKLIREERKVLRKAFILPSTDTEDLQQTSGKGEEFTLAGTETEEAQEKSGKWREINLPRRETKKVQKLIREERKVLRKAFILPSTDTEDLQETSGKGEEFTLPGTETEEAQEKSGRGKEIAVPSTETEELQEKSEQGTDFPKRLCLEYKDVQQVFPVLRAMENINPKTSETSLVQEFLDFVHIDEFKSRLKSLESSVLLVDPIHLSDRNAGDGLVCIFKVNVKPSNKVLTVQEPKDSLEHFLSLKHLPRSFFVSSDSVCVIDAKLAVYKKYKHIFEEDDIMIFHELDDAKEYLPFCIIYTLNTFKVRVKTVMDAIPMRDIQTIVEKAANISFSFEQIRNHCRNIDIDPREQYIRPYHYQQMHKAIHAKTIFNLKLFERVGQAFLQEILAGIVNHIQKIFEQKLPGEVNKAVIQDFTIKLTGSLAITTIVFGILVRFFDPFDESFGHKHYLLMSDDMRIIWLEKQGHAIYEMILAEKKAKMINYVVEKMRGILHQTAKELMRFNANLADASRMMPIVDQKKLIDEWMLREFQIENIERCPSVLHFIAGRKKEAIVMKVFLENHDKTLEQFCRDNAVHVPESASFEFVNVESKSKFKKSKTSLQQGTEGRCFKRDTKKISKKYKDTKKRIKKILKENKDKLFAKHSTLISITMSPVKCSGESIIDEPCILLYCLDADLIPFGEEPLPQFLEGYECNIREDFLQLGKCRNCTALNLGCSVGKYGNKDSGSFGFFVKRRLLSSHNSCDGFLTAAHVALTDDVIGELNQRKLSDCSVTNQIYQIVHPSFRDSASMYNNIIGQVEDSFFGTHNSVGVDAAFIRIDGKQIQYKMHEASQNFEIDSDDDYEEYDVIKNGRTSDETTGIFKTFPSHTRFFTKTIRGIFFQVDESYQIHDLSKNEEDIFFYNGDSGSAVHVINKEDGTRQPLGLAFARQDKYRVTYACPIKKITDLFNLSIVQPANP